MMLGARTAAWAKSGYTAKDYVQDGLICQIDSFENAGYGIHDTSSITDLTGNYQITKEGSFPSIGYDGIAFDGSADLLWNFEGFLQALKNGEATISFCCKPLRVVNNGGIICCGFSYRNFWLWSHNNDPVYGFFAATQYGGSGYEPTPLPVGLPDLCQVTVTFDDSSASFYFNGEYVGFVSRNEGPVNNSYFSIGKLGSYKTKAVFNMYDFLAYNKGLSQTNIAANYAIDKARFNLP